MKKKLPGAQWGIQVLFLLWKNYLLNWRAKKALLVQVIAPIILIASLWFIQKAIENNYGAKDLFDDVRHSKAVGIPKIPACVVGASYDYCYTFTYAPQSTDPTNLVEQIVTNIRTSDGIPANKVRGFPDALTMNNWMRDNKNRTQGGYIFNVTQDAGVTSLTYTLQSNETNTRRYGVLVDYTLYVQIPMYTTATREIMKLASGNPDLVYNMETIEYAHPQVDVIDIIGTGGPLFIFGAVMFNVVVCMEQIVLEKQLHLRQHLNIMGLKDSAFWVSWFVTQGIFATGTTFLIIITGLICQFNFFLKNFFFLYFWVIWLFSLAMIPFTFLVSVFLKKSENAVLLGFLIFVAGFILQFTVSALYTSGSVGYKVLQYLLALFAPVMLAKGLVDLSDASAASYNDGLSALDAKDNISPWPLVQVYCFLILDLFIYLLLALYFDNVLPSTSGTRKPLWYFILPSYWLGSGSSSSPPTNENEPEFENMDEDVFEEEMRVRKGEYESEAPAILVTDLNKTYKATRKGGFCRCCNCLSCAPCCECFCGKRVPKFVAVNDMWLEIPNNQLFCLLGPNGAGKTTTISMLTGLVPPSHGTAFLNGHSVTTDLTAAHKTMSVCPQFDVLWNDMTGKEHLMLFGAMKGVPLRRLKKVVREHLESVALTEARNVVSASYSGGMKRRLSVALALIGDPRIVFLDEPTTGMDPVSRRQVWDCIERAKKDRAIILTTHSMEEADILGDKIAIMVKGRIRCLGSSLRLKNKFGTGYRFTISVPTERQSALHNFVIETLPGAEKDNASISNFVIYNVSQDQVQHLPHFLSQLEQRAEEFSMTDVQLSLATLEEVFLRIVTDADPSAAMDSDDEDDDDGKICGIPYRRRRRPPSDFDEIN